MTSDTHGDVVTDGFERQRDVEEALDQVVEYCSGDDVFMHLGDCANPYTRGVHRAIGSIMSAASKLGMRDVVNVWLTGNHDVVESGHLDHTLIGLKRMSNVEGNMKVGPMHLTHVFDHPCAIRLGPTFEFLLICLPYTAPSHSYDPAAYVREFAETDAKRVIVAGHLMIEGIGPGSETADMRRGRDVFFPLETCNECFPDALLLNGHYHDQQVFRGIHVPGSPVRLTHGEENNQPGFMVIELD